MYFYFLMLLFLIPTTLQADPSAAKIGSQQNSKCTVKSSQGEYPTYKVLKEGKEIYVPKSDGIVKAIISPSGKYVALSAGEVSLLDVESGKFEFGVVVVNCENGNRRGYLKGKPTLISKWNGDKGIEIFDFLNLSGNSGETLP